MVFAATLIPGYTHSILQDHVTGTAASPAAHGGVQTHGVTVEIRTGPRTGLPTGPFHLASFAVFK